MGASCRPTSKRASCARSSGSRLCRPDRRGRGGARRAVATGNEGRWVIPGVDRHPLKKLEPDEEGLLRLLRRWQDEAAQAGRTISRIAVAFEAGRDGFWLARWLRTRGIRRT